MYPYGSRLLAQLVQHRVGKTAIQRLVAGPERSAVKNSIQCDMTEWPEYLVRIALAAVSDHGRVQPDPPQSISRRIRRHRETVSLTRHLMIGISAAPSNPHAAKTFHDRVQSRNQSSISLPADYSVIDCVMLIWLTV